MRSETEAKIRNVRKFGRYARAIAAVSAALVLLFMVFIWGAILAGPWAPGGGPKIGIGAYIVTGDHLLGAPVKAWSLIVVTVMLGITAWILFQLHLLFSELAVGSIYAKPTVWHLRQVGLWSMAAAVIQLILPPLSFALAEIGYLDRALLTAVDSERRGNALSFGPVFGGFITASMILLASWIMDVGRETAEDAEAMRREADLVI